MLHAPMIARVMPAIAAASPRPRPSSCGAVSALHTADELAHASNYDPLAEQHDFIVLYPDNGGIDKPARCASLPGCTLNTSP